MIDTALPPEEFLDSRSGAALLLDVLRSEGVRHVFGNPGTTEMPFMRALARSNGPAYVLGLQEATVVGMADGYAQATRRPAFVNLHTAGGLGNAMGALLHAQTARTPLVITAGQQDTRHAHADPLLSGDATAMATPVTKWARELAHPGQVPVMLRRAFQDCATHPRGPVFLSLPIDVMERRTTTDLGSPSRIERSSTAGGLDALAQALAETEPGRLALIVGDEVEQSDAVTAVVRLAETLATPVYGPSWPGCMSFPTAHLLWTGNLPTTAAAMRAELARFDAVFVLGGNPFTAYLHTGGPALPPTCRLLQLSANAGELGRTHPTALACHGDIKATLRALDPLLAPKMLAHASLLGELRRDAGKGREARLSTLARRIADERGAATISPFVAAGEVLRVLPPGMMMIDEAPVTMNHIRDFLPRHPVGRYLFMRSAILGWGMPAAVGASLGLDRSPVVALVGDGSSLYSPQALWTAAREKLPITFVVMNNREYAILKSVASQTPSGDGAGSVPGLDLLQPPIDFPSLAAGFGVPARRVSHPSHIAGAIESGIASAGPNLVEVVLGAGG